MSKKIRDADLPFNREKDPEKRIAMVLAGRTQDPPLPRGMELGLNRLFDQMLALIEEELRQEDKEP